MSYIVTQYVNQITSLYFSYMYVVHVNSVWCLTKIFLVIFFTVMKQLSHGIASQLSTRKGTLKPSTPLCSFNIVLLSEMLN